MAEPKSQHPAGDAMQTAHRLAADLNAIWRSEMAALAVDREGQELWAAGMSSWGAHEAARWTDLFRPDDGRTGRGESESGGMGAGGHAGSDAPPWPAAGDAAPDAVAALQERLAELERRLAGRDS